MIETIFSSAYLYLKNEFSRYQHYCLNHLSDEMIFQLGQGRCCHLLFD